ncbi:MAG: sterol desaturase family protein [Pseudomonadales bacterium]|nr:sterol desaturase family protein [Pseudomonadales bacterium]
MRVEHLETLVGISLIFLFVWVERKRPIVANDKKVHLRLDILGFVAIFLFGRLSRATLTELGADLTNFFDQFFTIVHTNYALLPSVLRVVLAIIVVDFCLYWIHRFMHHPALWRVHIWHHSVENLYWFSGFRASLIHTFFFLTPQVLMVYLLGLTHVEAIAAFSFGVFIQFWQHANYDISLGAAERWIMTPRYHRIHHSSEAYIDMNYGTVFVVWDRLFGTYVDPAKADTTVPVGLANETITDVKSKRTLRMVLGV